MAMVFDSIRTSPYMRGQAATIQLVFLCSVEEMTIA